MKTFWVLVRRNMRLFFKDKGMFFTSLITPAILLVLYVTFLGNVYRDSFVMNLPAGLAVPEKLLDGLVAGQLISSILAVSCVTVAFCSNFLMVQDKALGTSIDLRISPVRPSTLSVAYYVSTLAVTLIICLAAAGLCLGYTAAVGWYMSAADVAKLLGDVVLLVLFGTALSSVVNFFLSSQGQISAVGTVVSSGYGFICGAYMPISSFGEGLQKVISFLPGTYGTALVRTHAMQGAISELESFGLPETAAEQIMLALDMRIRFFETPVSEAAMYLIVGGATAALVLGYVLLNKLKKR
ncbi:MAG: ABC transporter permease [Clostridia bacterium]|nr:ABC transporter permease [Clostridia bacterium]